MKTIRIKIIKEFIIEALLTVGFILCASLLSLWMGCIVYVGLFVVYAAINYKSIIGLFKNVFKRKMTVGNQTDVDNAVYSEGLGESPSVENTLEKGEEEQ